jgi:hypothetical protein
MASEKLFKLSKRELEVLYLLCMGVDYRGIADRLSIAYNTVRVHMGRIYVKLGLNYIESRTTRLQTLIEIYCPLVRQLYNTSPQPEPVEKEEEEPAPITARILDLVEGDEKGIIEQKSDQVITIDTSTITPKPSAPPASLLRLAFIGLLSGVLLMICLGGIGVVIWQQLSPQPPTPTLAALIAFASPPISTSQPLTPTDEPPLIGTATPTSTSLPPSPTHTPSATRTPSIALPFHDNFDQGLRTEWKVIEGQTTVLGGRLQGAGYRLTLQLGDESLSDYVISFDTFNSCVTNNTAFNITAAERIKFEFRGPGFIWRGFSGSDWQVLPGYQSLNSCAKSVRIVIAGGVYTVSISNALVLDHAQYGSQIRGPFTLELVDQQAIDNFSLSTP